MDLIFELIAPRIGYKQSDSFVPEPAAFLPFDLQALERSYGSETNSPLVNHALPALQAALIARQQWHPRAEPLVCWLPTLPKWATEFRQALGRQPCRFVARTRQAAQDRKAAGT
jgi:hypothetical protein